MTGGEFGFHARFVDGFRFVDENFYRSSGLRENVSCVRYS